MVSCTRKKWQRDPYLFSTPPRPGTQAADPASGKGGRVQYAYMPGYTKWEYPGNSGAQGVQALAARGAQRGQQNHGY